MSLFAEISLITVLCACSLGVQVGMLVVLARSHRHHAERRGPHGPVK